MEIVVAIGSLVISLGLTALFIWFFWRIARRAGYSGWWSLTMLIPLVNIVVIWLFAFAEWPALAPQGNVYTDPLPRDDEHTAPPVGHDAPAAGTISGTGGPNYTVTGNQGDYDAGELDPEGSPGWML